ncbi:ATP-NAD kinase-like domain-containing protein [Leucosporidium creatinivorum]|uniref:ATP-NAD kinase-like domain-containing protein n=1 Tax=Leucosporidium creatinivorum TaxID=106004 RepID=A0A1Y2G643_9BASI|nr:ATP-NAD kinase-like domain-containing protein [Leucosporidium creatinivorum]
MLPSFAGIEPHRRLLVFINPHGGQGKAQQIWENVAPIFKAARCPVHLQHTGPAESPNNATTLASEIDLGAWDALVPISGDGIINELLNGLASRPDALKALRMPIAPLPGGSGNALSVNLLGPEGVDDLALAVLGVIKGSPIPLDLCSVTHGDRRMFSFLSQAFGLAADLDIGTEWIRWMGDTRFTLGYLWGVFTRKSYSVEIILNVKESSKSAMASAYNAHQASSPVYEPPAVPSDLSMPTPSLSMPLEDDIPLHTELKADLGPGWHRMRVPIQILYGGKLPWVSRGSQQFPLATGRDGLIDLVVVPPRGVQESIKGLEGAERGAFLSSPSCYYYKVASYICRPIGSAAKGYISIDGESIPNEEFHVECHPGLARVMSLHGRWMGLDKIVLE